MKKIVIVMALSALSMVPALNAVNEQTATQPTRFKKALAQLSRPGHFGYGALKIAIAAGGATFGTLLLLKGSGCYTERRPEGSKKGTERVATLGMPKTKYALIGLASELTLLYGALSLARSGFDSVKKAFTKAA